MGSPPVDQLRRVVRVDRSTESIKARAADNASVSDSTQVTVRNEIILLQLFSHTGPLVRIPNTGEPKALTIPSHPPPNNAQCSNIYSVAAACNKATRACATENLSILLIPLHCTAIQNIIPSMIFAHSQTITQWVQLSLHQAVSLQNPS